MDGVIIIRGNGKSESVGRALGQNVMSSVVFKSLVNRHIICQQLWDATTCEEGAR